MFNPPELAIDVVVPGSRMRFWQLVVVERLQALGHDVVLRPIKTRPCWSRPMDWALTAEHGLLPGKMDDLARIVPRPRTEATQSRPIDLVVDLTGSGVGTQDAPVFSLAFDNHPSPGAALRAVIEGRLPDIAVMRDGVDDLETGRPMVDTPASTVRALNDVLARAVTLMVSAVTRHAQQRLSPLGPRLHRAAATDHARGLLGAYAFRAVPRLVREAIRRLRYRQAHWRVGYRMIPGPGVAETGRLGTGWSVLPDNGDRFFADPFVFQRHGKTYVFVEDYDHRLGKAVISVSEADAEGRLSAPVQVLEEPYHLSYPQVFERDGAIWMLPESSSGKNLVLYRATHFPHTWTRHAVLLDDREISDATLLDHGDRLWLFATERDGFGSTSDTLVVYSALALTGPWTPHKNNPIRVDRAAARPGGAFIREGNRLILPLQDGTTGYGGHLGLCDLLALDDERVTLSPVRPIDPEGDWLHPRIHTLNRAGDMEVIDGIAPPPRLRRPMRRQASSRS